MNVLRHKIIIVLITITLNLFVPTASSANVNNTATFTILQDFRSVLMYFSESFLKVQFWKQQLEGEIPLLMPKKFIHILGCLENEYKTRGIQNSKIKHLTVFRNQLEAGLEVAVQLMELPKRLDENNLTSDNN